jgi:NAD(P)H-nitrite reductase large subunit
MADSGATTLDEIRNEFGATLGCGLCLPYIKKMLQTGETEFAIDTGDDQ